MKIKALLITIKAGQPLLASSFTKRERSKRDLFVLLIMILEKVVPVGEGAR